MNTLWILGLGLMLMVGCSDEESSNNQNSQANNTNTNNINNVADIGPDMPVATGPSYRFDPARDDFFNVPWPSDLRKKVDGTMGYTDFPGLAENRIAGKWLSAADDLKTGWGLTSAVYTHWEVELDVSTLPSLEQSIATDTWPSVFLMNVEDGSPKRGERLPIDCVFIAPEGTYHPANQLACASPYGVLRERSESYALVFTDGLKDVEGNPVGTPAAFQKLIAGTDLEGVNGTVSAEPYQKAHAAIVEAGLPAEQIRGFALFTTFDPTERFLKVTEFYAGLDEPELEPSQPMQVVADYPDYLVLEAFYNLPLIQEGPRPYAFFPAGRIIWGEDGAPVVQEMETVKVFITVPKSPMPEGGFPILFYMHGSGGSATELINRGSRMVPEDTPAPGSGPASVIAPYGIAGVSVDFALHDSRWPRNPDTSGLKLYNILDNPRAMIDNFAIASNEVTMHARLMANLTIDPSIDASLDAGDAADGLIRFNSERFTAMGQSMGSMIGTPTMTIPGHIRAFINAGSGGTMIEIALETRDPYYLKPLLSTLMRVRDDEEFNRHEIILNAMQHVFDHMDPTLHARHVIREPHPGVPPRHVFHPSGLEDRYFSPAARAGLSTALGVPLVEPVLQEVAFDWMQWAGNGSAIQAPVQENLAGGVTGFVRQYEPAYPEGGHYVMFDKPEAKAQYACFLKSLKPGEAPVLRSPEASTVENCP